MARMRSFSWLPDRYRRRFSIIHIVKNPMMSGRWIVEDKEYLRL